MEFSNLDPLAIPEILSILLDFCDLETLKNARLVNKVWHEVGTRSIRPKSAINLTNHNLSSIVATLDESVNLFDTTRSFPVASFRINQALGDSPAFFRLFNDYVKLVHSLEICCVALYETFSQCQSIDFSSHVLSSLKDLKVTSTYHEWYHHMTKAEERVHIRKCVCETIISIAPNLQKLHLDLRLGPWEWATFLKSAARRLKNLKKLYFQLFISEDTDEYYADGKFVKDFVLDPVFKEMFPHMVREIGPGVLKLTSLSLDLLSDVPGEMGLEIMKGVAELYRIICSTLVHLHQRSICQQPERNAAWSSVGKSFAVMPNVETSKVEWLYMEVPVHRTLPTTKMFPKLRKCSMAVACQEDNLDQFNIQKWVNGFTGSLTLGNTTVTELDLHSFTLVGFSSKVLPELVKYFMVLKVLTIDFHPTCKIGTENWATICKDLRRLEVLSVRVLNGDKEYYAIQCDEPAPGAASKVGEVLAEDGINWTKVLTGISEEGIRRLREAENEGLEEVEVQNFRVCPSLVDLENLRVFKLVDKSPTGILNDDICEFGFMKMKRLKQLYLSSTENVSEQCFLAMKSVLDIFIMPVEDSVDTSSVIDEAVEGGDSFSDSDIDF